MSELSNTDVCLRTASTAVAAGSSQSTSLPPAATPSLTMSNFLSDYNSNTMGRGRYMETNAAGQGDSNQYIFRRFDDMANFAMSQRSERAEDATPMAVAMTFTPDDSSFAGDGTITFAGDEERLLPPGAQSSIVQTFCNNVADGNARAHYGNFYQ